MLRSLLLAATLVVLTGVAAALAQEDAEVRLAREYIEAVWKRGESCVLPCPVGRLDLSRLPDDAARRTALKRAAALREAGLVDIAEVSGGNAWVVSPTAKLLAVATLLPTGNFYCLNGTRRTPLQHEHTDRPTAAGAPILVYFSYKADLPPEEFAFWTAYWGVSLSNPASWRIRVHLIREPSLPAGLKVQALDAIPAAMSWDQAETAIVK